MQNRDKKFKRNDKRSSNISERIEKKVSSERSFRNAKNSKSSEKSNGDFKRKDDKKPTFRKPFVKRISKRPIKSDKPGMRLNQFLAHSGVSSRREADNLIKAGLVQVNGKTIVEMGFRVLDADIVKFNNETISSETKRYLLLNKPKDYLTSTDDPKKKNVYELTANACKERLYPVGRLDR